MNTLISLPRVAAMVVALGTAGVTATFAQSTTTTPATTTPTTPSSTGTTGEKHHHHHLASVLSSDERAQLKKAHEAALAADPTLASDKDALKQKFESLKAQGSAASKDDWTALKTQREDFHTKLRAAELKADPTLTPVFSKIDAAKAQHGHHSQM